jgi:hypothetical protein
MLIAMLEALSGVVAAAAIYGAVSLAARGYKNKQRELIGKRLAKRS